ncbi:zeatin O-glucosyltransferase-like [Mercurialis annua]|uniref:zeatin O-glucosyltransferase-like n=1 Tax=Mercurialis annua TaxID=3986 RepID=UPI00215EFABD|nr:zeatin O-glucosyltransferase-like [Mercurialis annua]
MANPQHQIDLKQAQLVVVMVPLPLQGHLNQLLQLSRLILSYNIPVHFVGAATHNRQAKLRVHGWDPQIINSNIHFHDFEIPSFACPPPNPNAKNKFPSHLQPAFISASSHLQDHVSALLRSLSCKASKVIVIHDSLMGSIIQEVRFISNAESYTFHSVSAFTIFLFRLGKENKLIPKNIPSLDGCFTNEFLDFISCQYSYQDFSSGYIFNTCRLIEGDFMELLQNEHKTYWALGPFNPVNIPERNDSEQKHYSLSWLDKQETNSVIYVSFGTTTTMSNEQIKQLAIGLKQSNQKFIWVLRDADKGDVFDVSEHDRRIELPKGYEEDDLVRGVGLVVRDWAPQLEILGHRAVGGFMSHCGWNSCMESITMGVPIAAWPMHSDQPRNAVLIAEILKIGVYVKDWSLRNEVATAKMVETCVKRLMASKEGDVMRKRAGELGDSIRRSTGDGGVTRSEMDSFIAHICR